MKQIKYRESAGILDYIKFAVGFQKRRIKKLEAAGMLDRTRFDAMREIQNASLVVSEDVIENAKYSGNSYKDYGTATEAIKDKYTCQADWGVTLTGAIIDFRSALISGDQININEKNKTDNNADDKRKDKDLVWIKAFLDANGLNDYRFMDMVNSTDIEGRLLWKIRYDSKYEWLNEETKKIETGMVMVTPKLWINNKYDVETNEDSRPDKIVFNAHDEDDLEEKEFVYRKFGGLIDDWNNPVQKLWRCLDQIETIEKCLRDLRQINHLYASPRPYMKCAEEKSVKETIRRLNARKNWKLGSIFVGSAEFSYVQPDMSHVLSLLKEIYINIQMISATTGIPPHWLALVDLMSNRSTAEDLGDITELSVSKERQIIKSALNELLRKAAVMQHENTKITQVEYYNYDITLSVISDEQWKHLKDLYLPAAKNKLISTQDFLEQIPGIDSAAALERLKEEMRDNAISMFKEDFEMDEGSEDSEDNEENEIKE